MAISKSNQVTRRRARKANIDNVDGNRIKLEGPKIVRRLKGENVRKGASLLTDDLKQELNPTDSDSDNQNIDEVSSVKVSTPGDPAVEKVKISMSGDVIFTPYTDGTQYACRRDATANLRRRMPDFDIFLSDVSGEGQIDFTVSASFNVDGQDLSVTARGLASPYEMAVHTVEVLHEDRTFNINPVDRARSPEDTVNFLKRVAINCVQGIYS